MTETIESQTKKKKKTPLTNAERQARHRQKQKSGDKAKALSPATFFATWLSFDAKFSLDLLAHHYQLGHRELLEKLLSEQAKEIQSTMSKDEFNAFQRHWVK